MKPDSRDVFYLVGLACIGGGTYAVDWRASLIVVGVVLLVTALFAARRAK